MMQTINISLPRKLSTEADRLVEEEGYASRSELFRTLLRFYLQLKTERVKPFFVSFQKRSLREIKEGLEMAGYKPEFVRSVVSGLSKSSIYNENKTVKEGS